jgi:hypothetical protein
MSNLKPCVFTIKGEEMSYDEMRQYLLDNYDQLSVASTATSSVVSEKQKAINDAIDRAAKFVKDALRVQNRGVVSMGFDADTLIDNLAKGAKILVDSGISVAEAVKMVIERAEKQINSFIKDGHLDPNINLEKEVEKAVNSYNKPSEVKRRLRGTIEAFVERSDVADSIKEKLLADEESYLVQLGRDNAIALAKEVIESLGGIEAALDNLASSKTDIPVDIQSIIYGEGLNWAKENRIKATSQEDIDYWADRENEIHQRLAAKATSFGRFIAYLYDVYTRSGYAMVRETKKAIEKRNSVMRPNAKKLAAKIKAILDDLSQVGESVSEALSSTTTASITALEKKIKQLETKIEKLKKEPAASKKPATKSKVSPKEAKDAIAFLLNFGKPSSTSGTSTNQPTRRSIPADASPEVMSNLYTAGRYFVELGYTSFDEFYKKMNKELKGKFENHYADVYNNSREFAIENGADASLFTSQEEVNKIADQKFEEQAELERELQEAKDELERTRKKKAIENLMKEPNPPSGPPVTREQKLRTLAAELDAELGGSAYTDIVDAFIGSKEAKEQSKKADAKRKSEIKAFYDMMSAKLPTGTKDTRTKEQKLLDAAADLDAAMGGDNFTRQAQAFIAMGSNISDIVEQALIDAGFSKMVTDPKTGNKIEVVDWKALTTDSKSSADTIAKIRQAIIDKYGANSPILSELDAIEQQADKLIKEKKAKAVAAEIKRISRAKNKVQTIVGKRKSNIQKMLDKWKQGAFDEQQIMDDLADELGLVAFTAEDQATMEAMLDEIERAPTGVEKERIEEKLQAFLTYKKHPTFALASFRQWMKGSLLTGFVTAIKNFTGGMQAVSQLIKEYAMAQAKAGGDAKMNATVIRSFKKALRVALDLLINGSVDPGVAQSEITGTKEGSPSVRFMENRRSDLGMRGALYVPSKIFDTLPKYILRAIGSVDSFFNTLLQDVKTYNLARTMIKERNPNISSAEANRMAYEETWGMEIMEAEIQAEKEFADRGISIDGFKGRVRFRRRVNEIVEQKRKPEIVKMARSFGARNTFKEQDMGVASMVGALWTQFISLHEKALKALRDTDSKLAFQFANALEFTLGLTFDLLTPFVKGTANFMEKGLEHFAPYGIAKAAAYAIPATESKISKRSSEYNFDRVGEYVWNAVLGTALTAFIMSLGDDDEEDKEKAIYGAGSEDWDELKNRRKQRPANSIVINGSAYNFDLFGPLSIPLRIEASQLDKKRYGKEEGVGTAIDVLVNMISSPYLETPGQMIRNIKKGEYSTLLKRQGSEFVTRAAIPAVGFFRQAGQLYKPQAMTPITFMEHLYKQSGIFMVGKLDRPAFDYRGKTYDQGEVNPGSPDGMRRLLLSKKGAIDDIDKFVFKYAPSVGVVNTNVEKYKIYDEGSFRPMTDEEEYDFKFNQAQKFDKLITKYKSTNPESWLSDPLYRTAVEQDVSDSDLYSAKQAIKKENESATAEELDKLAMEKALNDKLNSEIKSKINELSRISSYAAFKETIDKYGLTTPPGFEEAVDDYNFELDYME